MKNDDNFFSLQKNLRMLAFEEFLIKEEDNQNVGPVLADIRKYSVGILLKFTKQDFTDLRKKGFELKELKLTSCRHDLREFLELHPCCMSGEKEKIKEKVLFYLREHLGDIEVEIEEPKPKRKSSPVEEKPQVVQQEFSSTQPPQKVQQSPPQFKRTPRPARPPVRRLVSQVIPQVQEQTQTTQQPTHEQPTPEQLEEAKRKAVEEQLKRIQQMTTPPTQPQPLKPTPSQEQEIQFISHEELPDNVFDEIVL